MAIAIGSHATPAQGLYTSIVGGFLRGRFRAAAAVQIGGLAGAFIVLVAATVQQHGMDGLILATILSGIMLMAIGYLRPGTYIKFIPVSGYGRLHRRHRGHDLREIAAARFVLQRR